MRKYVVARRTVKFIPAGRPRAGRGNRRELSCPLADRRLPPETADALPTNPAPGPESRQWHLPPRPADARALWLTAGVARGPLRDRTAPVRRVPLAVVGVRG